MRKAASFFMLVLLIWSCNKNDEVSPKKVHPSAETGNIKKAQSYFESNETRVIVNPNANGSSALSLLGQNKGANWANAREFETGKEKIIEVPITFEKKQGHVTSSDISKRRTESDVRSLTYLVMKSEDNSNYKYALMTLIPFDESRNSGKLKLEDNHYKNISKEFSGLVVFHTWQNKFLNGWVYKNGQIISRLKTEGFVNRNSPKKELYDNNCETYIVTKWCLECFEYASGREVCNSPYVCDEFYLNYCDETGGGDGDFYEKTDVSEVAIIRSLYEIDDRDLTSPCFKAVFNMLKDNAVMTDMGLLLNQTFNITGSANIFVREQPLTGISGRHYGGSSASIVIINSNLLPNASKEFIAATLMHEILHGVLTTQGNIYELQQHEEIANKYVETMVSSLTLLFPNLSEASARALTWGGLQDTNAYANLSQDYKVNLGIVNMSHQTGVGGTKCN